MATSMPCILVFSVVLMYVLPSESFSVSDPCVTHVSIPKGKYRGTKCDYRHGKAISDRYMNGNLWYKADGYNGPLSMPTNPVNLDQCSTKMPIWMNGTHPETGVTVNRTACMTGPTTNCQVEYKIQVKNCSAFNVYQLQVTTGMEMAYCFGENETCPPTDPCEDIDREELPDDGHRGRTCSPMNLCDNNIKGWYRVNKNGNDGAGLKMADKCPKPGYCGATSPIWLEERHPTPSDGNVTRGACVRNETDCCGERFQIGVVNCGSYFVYELSARTTCPERYCFGNFDDDIACITANNTFGHNSGCHLPTNTILEVISAFLLSWMCSRRWQ